MFSTCLGTSKENTALLLFGNVFQISYSYHMDLLSKENLCTAESFEGTVNLEHIFLSYVNYAPMSPKILSIFSYKGIRREDS